jgi:hypothetical protein
LHVAHIICAGSNHCLNCWEGLPTYVSACKLSGGLRGVVCAVLVGGRPWVALRPRVVLSSPGVSFVFPLAVLVAAFVCAAWLLSVRADLRGGSWLPVPQTVGWLCMALPTPCLKTKNIYIRVYLMYTHVCTLFYMLRLRGMLTCCSLNCVAVACFRGRLSCHEMRQVDLLQ